METDPFAVIADDRVTRVLRRLHAEADRQTPGLVLHFLPKIPRLLLGRPLGDTEEHVRGYYADKFICLGPDQTAFWPSLRHGASARGR